MVIDYLEDDNDFIIWDIVPVNRFSISSEVWLKMAYDFLLYIILCWWQECFEEDMELLPVRLEEGLAHEISARYPSEDGNRYVLKAITTYEE